MTKSSLHLLAYCCWFPCCCGAIAEDRVRSAMEHDPSFPPQKVVHTAPEGLLPLWLDALKQEDVESEVVCQVARGLIRFHRLGIALEGRAVEQLAKQLSRKELDLAARLAVARALVELDAKEQAALLAAQLPQGGRDMAEIVEPALARWRDPALREQWLGRLEDPHTSRRALYLAIQAVGRLQEPVAQSGLVEIAADQSQPLSIRLEAAKSLSITSDSGLETHADRLLAADDASQGAVRLIAVRMLARHSGPAAEELLLRLAADDEPAVAAAAVARLIHANAGLLKPHRSKLLQSPDAKLRLFGIQVVQHDPGSRGISLLGGMLDDEHLGVRRAAGKALIDLSGVDGRREGIGRLATDLLEAEFPRRTEQALLVLAALDFEQAVPRVVELLDAPEPSISVTAAWALQRLAAPDSGDQIFAHVVRETDRSVDIVKQLSPHYADSRTPDIELPDLSAAYAQQEHLILGLGQLRYEQADGFLRQFIPKPSQQPGDPPPLAVFTQPRPRAAAIWALGKIHAGRGDQASVELLDMITERMADTTPIPREEPIVRRMAAISLGRIGSLESLPLLQKFFDPAAAHDDVGRACAWSIEQLTGHAPKLVTARTTRHVDWFLVPLDP